MSESISKNQECIGFLIGQGIGDHSIVHHNYTIAQLEELVAKKGNKTFFAELSSLAFINSVKKEIAARYEDEELNNYIRFFKVSDYLPKQDIDIFATLKTPFGISVEEDVTHNYYLLRSLRGMDKAAKTVFKDIFKERMMAMLEIPYLRINPGQVQTDLIFILQDFLQDLGIKPNSLRLNDRMEVHI